MNRQETREAAETMLAWAGGRTVQQRRLGDMDAQWYTPHAPIWNWDHFEYRKKPEPREGWVMLSDIHGHSSGCRGANCIRVREVLNDE